jgi:hypothetical protein
MFSRATARVVVDTAEDPNPRRGRTIGGKREVLSALQMRERERETKRVARLQPPLYLQGSIAALMMNIFLGSPGSIRSVSYQCSPRPKRFPVPHLKKLYIQDIE